MLNHAARILVEAAIPYLICGSMVFAAVLVRSDLAVILADTVRP